ncbi:sensor histidine kinase [Dactylosporangium sp. NPDC000521]|uniref:sensor histidine kinase n=1 Tax=Dactylosporangium sp. NPDC000521 TaxID=3363975 RepID=UPI00368AD441
MQRLLDASLIALLVVATLLWSDALLLFGEPDFKVLSTFGSAAAWRLHTLWWSLAAIPSAVAIVLRHRWPLTATILAICAAVVHLLDPVLKSPPTDVAVLITMYALTSSEHRRQTVLATLVATEALLFTGALVNGAGITPSLWDSFGRVSKVFYAAAHGDAVPMVVRALQSAAVPALLLAATWAVADSARTRRLHVAVLQARTDDLEREQEQRTALAVASERGRITRELHDVVAHGLSVMVIQAQGAKAMLHRSPERSDAALATIVTTGRASLAEMRRLLNLVRSPSDTLLVPQPSLATLPELIDRVRASGVPVTFSVAGAPATLPAVIELAAYRIVQEALTNTLKHATPGASCTVRLTFDPSGLRILVCDDGRAAASSMPGNGLRGIAERVAALNGVLAAGPAPDGGFEVSAFLPLELVA